MECVYCGKRYSNKSNLLLHQRTTAKCLSVQGKDEKPMKCNVCKQQYSILSISKHKCKPKMTTDNKVLELKEELRRIDEELRRKDEELKRIKEIEQEEKKEVIVKNKDIIIPHETRCYFQHLVTTKFSESYFLDGQKGVARFLFDYVLSDDGKLNYMCTDLSRKVFILKLCDNLSIKDFRCAFIINLVADDVIAQSRLICQRAIAHLQSEYVSKLIDIQKIKYDNASLVSWLAVHCQYNNLVNSSFCGKEEEKIECKTCNEMFDIEIMMNHIMLCRGEVSGGVVRKSIPKTVRIALWEIYFTDDNAKGNCNVCNCEIKITNFEAGHIIASAKGGNDNIDNLVPVCSLCNKSMGVENLLEFKAKYFSSRVEDENNVYLIE